MVAALKIREIRSDCDSAEPRPSGSGFTTRTNSRYATHNGLRDGLSSWAVRCYRLPEVGSWAETSWCFLRHRLACVQYVKELIRNSLSEGANQSNQRSPTGIDRKCFILKHPSRSASN